MSELCEHSDFFDDRSEYCEQEAADPNGKLANVTELIDALLYEKGNGFSEDYMLSSTNKLLFTMRTVSLVLLHPEVSEALPLEVNTTITHQINKELATEHYGVDVNWRLASPYRDSDGSYRKIYFMDIFSQGRVLTCLDEPDLVYGGREERPMTGYDYTQLINDLSQIHNMQLAE